MSVIDICLKRFSGHNKVWEALPPNALLSWLRACVPYLAVS